MTQNDIIFKILAEKSRAQVRWPLWPNDPIHAAGILSEEAGELVRAANQFSYEDGKVDDMVIEAVQVGAMVVRFLEGLDKYEKIRKFCDDSAEV